MRKKKLFEKSEKIEWKSLDTRWRKRCPSYSILFNLWGSPGFYYWCQNQRNRVRLFISMLPARKSAFFTFFIQKSEEIESLKNEKSPGIVLEKSWNSVFPFRYQPWHLLLNHWSKFKIISQNCSSWCTLPKLHIWFHSIEQKGCQSSR